MSVIAGAAAVPHTPNVLPAAAAVAVLCERVIAEITALPGVLLPGGTVTPLAGTLIAAGPVAAQDRFLGGGTPDDGKSAGIESYDVSGA